MSFATLGLSEALLRAVADQGYTEPTPVQAEAIPVVLAGHDLLAGAQTGTGKTAGFVLPLLQLLSAPGANPTNKRGPRALILTPTRELAAQVEASVRAYGKHLKLSSMALYGGVGFGGQAARLKRGVDIVVATPGRLLDHHTQRNISFANISMLVLDEADRMLDMGFIPDVRRIVSLVPRQRQTLMFSATFSDEIRKLASSFQADPKLVQVTPRNSTVTAIEQLVHPVDRERKAELLAFLIGRNRWRQVLVFTRTKHGADKLTHSLERDGITAVALHGNKSQGARMRALADFKQGEVSVLVATDIAARGIDIDQLPHVVNYDLPNVPEDYVHRIGRTGRAGADGKAVSLVCVDEHIFLRDIERLTKQPITKETVAGFEPDPNARAQNIFAQRGRRPAGAGAGAPARHGAEARGRGHGGGHHAAAANGRSHNGAGHGNGASYGRSHDHGNATGHRNNAASAGHRTGAPGGGARTGAGGAARGGANGNHWGNGKPAGNGQRRRPN